MDRTKEMQRIQQLTELWYSCLIDHHKDRDCHFTIEEQWSYGRYPTYTVHHYGYVADEWHSPEFKSVHSAYKWLIKKLIEQIKDEANGWLERMKRDDEGWEHKEHFEKILAKLTPTAAAQEEDNE